MVSKIIFDQGLNYVLVKSFTIGLGVARHLVQRELNRWSQFSEQKLRFFSKVKILNNDGHIGFISDKKNWGGCHHLLLVYDASKLITVYVVK